MRPALYVTSRAAVLGMLGLLLLSACRGAEPAEEAGIRSHLAGRLTVNPEVDSIPDYRDFEVLVTRSTEEGFDTLGIAHTDSTGSFSMDVRAPERGVYPLIISRRGTVLKVDQLAVSDGDSATVQVEFPVGARPLRIRSRENAAWMAYKNTKALYNQAVYDLLQAGGARREDLAQNVGQTASILWSMRDNYGGTIGADLAAAESVLMLDGWNDSLLVVRAREIEPTNLSFVEVARAARRAETRLHGPEAGLDLLRSFITRVPPERREDLAALETEFVLAYMQSDRRDEAVAKAREIAQEYPESPWAGWAERVTYDLEHLMPGMDAPAFTVRTLAGETVRLDSLRGQYVLLEFFRPEDEVFQRELDARNALARGVPEASFEIVSVSVQPDTLLNQAFLEGRSVPGHVVIGAQGAESEIVRQYNVSALPRRFLIGPDGKIISNYEGAYITSLQEEVATLLSRQEPPS